MRDIPHRIVSNNHANDMQFSPNGQWFACIRNNDIAIIDVQSGDQLHLLRLHTDAINDIEFSPDGSRLASVSNDRKLAVWDTSTGALLWSQVAHKHRASDVAFHPTLPTLATAGSDAMVRFWSTREPVADDSVRLVGEFVLSVGECATLKFSSDGETLFVHHRGLGVTAIGRKHSPSSSEF